MTLGPTTKVTAGSGFLAGCVAGECWRHVALSQLPIPIGALLAFVPLALRRQQMRMEETLRLVWSMSIKRGYRDWEARYRRWDIPVYALIWLSTVATAGVSDAVLSPAMAAMRMCLSGICTAVILSLSYAIVCICRSLIVMVDTFCCEVVGAMPLERVVHAWNLTQAVHRKASVDVEICLLALCGILAVSIPLLVVDVGPGGGLLSRGSLQ